MKLESMGMGTGMEKQFSPLPDEIKRERDKAVRMGNSPDEAEAAFRARFTQAQSRTREAAQKEAIASLEKFAEDAEDGEQMAA